MWRHVHRFAGAVRAGWSALRSWGGWSALGLWAGWRSWRVRASIAVGVLIAGSLPVILASLSHPTPALIHLPRPVAGAAPDTPVSLPTTGAVPTSGGSTTGPVGAG